MNKLAFLGIFILLGLTACSLFSITRDRDIYAFLTFASTDNQIRYMLVDMQLGGDLLNEENLIGPPLYDFLRSRVPVVEQAVTLWEQGVRVVNIERFYHSPSTDTITVNGQTASVSGLVYDRETTAFVDPGVILLTTDPQLGGLAVESEPTSQPITSGYATVQGYVAYPSEGWCPEMGLYARGSNGEQSNYSWNDGQCSFSFSVQAPGTYILFAWPVGEYSYLGFMHSADCVTPDEITVSVDEVVSNVVLMWCEAAYVPVP